MNDEHRRRRPRLRRRLRHAAALRRARRAAGRALRRAQPRRRGDDAHRRRDGLPLRCSTSAAPPASRFRWRSLSPALGGRCASRSCSRSSSSRLRANQIVSGLALTIFAGAAGLSSYLGNDFGLADNPARFSFGPLDLLGLARPRRSSGPIVFDQNWLVYASWLCVAAVGSLPGADAAGPQRPRGRRVARGRRRDGHLASRATATCTRSPAARSPASAARASASRSRRSGSTASRPGAGWIAIALVIFAFWRPDLCLVGAYLFGAFSALPLIAPGAGRRRSRRSCSRRCRT